jgi:hypothetical protein
MLMSLALMMLYWRRSRRRWSRKRRIWDIFELRPNGGILVGHRQIAIQRGVLSQDIRALFIALAGRDREQSAKAQSVVNKTHDKEVYGPHGRLRRSFVPSKFTFCFPSALAIRPPDGLTCRVI